MSNKMPLQPNTQQRRSDRLIWLFVLLGAGAGLAWIVLAVRSQPEEPVLTAAAQSELTSGSVATMDSPFFTYSDGWAVTTQGADPPEPIDAWNEPSGVVEFAFQGRELALEVAVGDYWGYFYATVDGQPANLLPAIPGNVDSQGNLAGYKTYYEPEKSVDGQPVTRWLRIHRVEDVLPGTLHHARIEVWRSWGQTPLRAVAVDALPAPGWPIWPGAVLLLAAIFVGQAFQLVPLVSGQAEKLVLQADAEIHPMLMGAIVAVVIVGVAVCLNLWWLCILGLALLGGVSVLRPALWLAALLFGLPFYFGVTLPILPGRNLGIIDVGVLGGIAAVSGNWGLNQWRSRGVEERRGESLPLFHSSTPLLLLCFLIAWALASAISAEHQALALREWRTVFLAAGLFALLLNYVLKKSPLPPITQSPNHPITQSPNHPITQSLPADRTLLLYAWLAGATVMALIALWQFATGSMLISAEGVYRVRGLYGSPNNLALYLERTLAVALGLTLFGAGRQRLVWGALSAIQLVALLLTFSKGGILLGLPAALATLTLIGFMGRQAQFPARRVLVIVAAVALLAVLIVAPFLGTERFQRLLDFSQGTGFIRLQLWRSAWQMALDHPLLGVGPDNFLYAYRSDYLLPAAWQEPNLNHPHNLFLDWWTRLGLPGLGLGLLFFGSGLMQLWRALRSKSNLALYAGLMAATAAGLAHGLIDVGYALPDLMIVWVMLFLLPPNQYENEI